MLSISFLKNAGDLPRSSEGSRKDPDGQPGLGWVVTGNERSWSLEWEDWVELGRALRMPTVQVTKFVYAMERDSGSGIADSDAAGNPNQHGDPIQAESGGLQDLANLPARASRPAAG